MTSYMEALLKISIESDEGSLSLYSEIQNLCDTYLGIEVDPVRVPTCTEHEGLTHGMGV